MNKKIIASELIKIAKDLVATPIMWRPFNENEIKKLLGLTISNIHARTDYKVTKIIDHDTVELMEEGNLRHIEVSAGELVNEFNYWNKEKSRKQMCGVQIQ